jgi:hypothetical protein
MGGFIDWVKNVTNSPNMADYRKKVDDSETVSLWQSLSYGANYKAAYCIGVCPAGEEVIGPFLDRRPEFLKDVVKPLQEKEETVYVIPGSDTETYVPKRFSNKTTKRVGNGVRMFSIAQFLNGLRLSFQREKSGSLNATYHFTFTGAEPSNATVVIQNKTLSVNDGHTGTPDIHLTADSRTWISFLNKEKNLIVALFTRKIKIKGSPRLLLAFSKCFPS